MRTWSIILFLLISFACTDEVSDVQVKFSKPSDYNMKIIPENPTSQDEISLIIFDDCTYNVLMEVTRNKSEIKIRKQFNSMMKWPCFQETDTISIGRLPEGSYTINYRLTDVSTQISNPEVLSIYFLLKVSN